MVVVVVGVLVTWIDLLLVVRRHWPTMDGHRQLYAVLLLLFYPLPCLQMLDHKRQPRGAVALVTYITLSFALKLAFSQ